MTVEGSVLALPRRLGSCELMCLVAQGGMADIYLARRAGSAGARHVAVKLLNATRASGCDTCAMFLDEARILALLDHPNIVSVAEIDVVDGQCYFAMEYVHGADLRSLLLTALSRGGVLPLATSLALVSAAATGLSHAHRRRGPDGEALDLVHCDVSLSNIMASHDGAVKIIDFGIASCAIASATLSPGTVRGKPNYMSPERCLGDPIDARSDVFGLGVVLYELTTGHRCFRGRTDFERMLAVVRGEYVPPSELVTGYPRELAHVVHTALSVDPARRFASAEALAGALTEVAAGYGWTLGAGAIRRTMRGLYGDVPEPWALHGDDNAVTEPRHAALPLAGDPTVPMRWLPGSADDDLERTRGARPLRRPHRTWLAA